MDQNCNVAHVPVKLAEMKAARSAAEMVASMVVHWVEQLAGEKDVKSAVSSVDSKVAM